MHAVKNTRPKTHTAKPAYCLGVHTHASVIPRLLEACVRPAAVKYLTCDALLAYIRYARSYVWSPWVLIAANISFSHFFVSFHLAEFAGGKKRREGLLSACSLADSHIVVMHSFLLSEPLKIAWNCSGRPEIRGCMEWEFIDWWCDKEFGRRRSSCSKRGESCAQRMRNGRNGVTDCSADWQEPRIFPGPPHSLVIIFRPWTLDHNPFRSLSVRNLRFGASM